MLYRQGKDLTVRVAYGLECNNQVLLNLKKKNQRVNSSCAIICFMNWTYKHHLPTNENRMYAFIFEIGSTRLQQKKSSVIP